MKRLHPLQISLVTAAALALAGSAFAGGMKKDEPYGRHPSAEPIAKPQASETKGSNATMQYEGTKTANPYGRQTGGDRWAAVAGRDPATVREAQEALQDKGYHPGPVDGVYGPNTQSAVRNFQTQQGLKKTGVLDRETLSALEIEYAGPSSNMGGISQDRPGTGRYPGSAQ